MEASCKDDAIILIVDSAARCCFTQHFQSPPPYVDTSVHVCRIFEGEASNLLASHRRGLFPWATTFHDVIKNREFIADNRKCEIDLSFYAEGDSLAPCCDVAHVGAHVIHPASPRGASADMLMYGRAPIVPPLPAAALQPGAAFSPGAPAEARIKRIVAEVYSGWDESKYREKLEQLEISLGILMHRAGSLATIADVTEIVGAGVLMFGTKPSRKRGGQVDATIKLIREHVVVGSRVHRLMSAGRLVLVMLCGAEAPHSYAERSNYRAVKRLSRQMNEVLARLPAIPEHGVLDGVVRAGMRPASHVGGRLEDAAGMGAASHGDGILQGVIPAGIGAARHGGGRHRRRPHRGGRRGDGRNRRDGGAQPAAPAPGGPASAAVRNHM